GGADRRPHRRLREEVAEDAKGRGRSCRARPDRVSRSLAKEDARDQGGPMKKRSFRNLFAEAEKDPAYWSERAILRVSEEIALAMERARVSRSALARRLGTSPAYVTKILRGNANFTVDSLARIAQALGG